MISSPVRLAALVAALLAAPSLARDPETDSATSSTSISDAPPDAAAPVESAPAVTAPPPAEPPDGSKADTRAPVAAPTAEAASPVEPPKPAVATSAQRDAETGLVRAEGESLRAFTVRVSEARRLQGRSDDELRALQAKVLVPAAIGLGTGIAGGLFAAESLRVDAELKLRRADNRTTLQELVTRGNHATTWAVAAGAVSVAAWSVSAYYLLIDDRPPTVSVVPMTASPGFTLTGVLP